jgi:hypothetical protein
MVYSGFESIRRTGREFGNTGKPGILADGPNETNRSVFRGMEFSG